MTKDAWDPRQYERFKDERQAPFRDLLALIQPAPGGRVADLGCGTGELTQLLHRRCGAAATLGLDASPAMLERAQAHADDQVRFVRGDLAAFGGPLCCEAFDVIASNAALHWVTDHPTVLARWARALRPGGQLAVQVPANGDHPAHALIDQIAREEPFRGALDSHGGPPADPALAVLAPERYAELLDELGFAAQHVRLQVYGHRLADSGAVVEWLKGSALTRLRGPLGDAGLYERFVTRFHDALLQRLGRRAPYFYTFKRILFWGRLAP